MKGIYAILFLIVLAMVGVNNTIDLKAMNPEPPVVKTEVADVIVLDPLAYSGSNIYATRDISGSGEGIEKKFCYRVSGDGKTFVLMSTYTKVMGTTEPPYLVIYRDYYENKAGEKITVTGEGYAHSDTYGSIRCELYLTKPGAGGVELANWYYTN